tara:strand:+ start:12569 stop:13078 length:510 start_codon:yes stop_codon:yes gene_type:complete
MSTLQQLREGLQGAWETLVDDWQRLSRRASSAITRFTPGSKSTDDDRDYTEQGLATRSTGWGVLTAEVFDDDDSVVVRIEAPGMEKSDFDLRAHDNYLVVRGEKRVEREKKDGHYRVTECAYGHFERAIALPAGTNMDAAQASYKNGVLRIEVPRAASHQRKRISIEVK